MPLPTSGVVDAADWNAEFDSLTGSLRTAERGEKQDGSALTWSINKVIATEHCENDPGAQLDDATDNKYTSSFFTPATNCILRQLQVGATGLSGQTVKVQLLPVVPTGASTYATTLINDDLWEDSDGEQPFVTLTTSGTNTEFAVQDFESAGYPYVKLKAGQEYELRLTLTSTIAQPWISYSALFEDWPHR